MRTTVAGLLALSCTAFAAGGALAQANWKPTKPITIIVPWPAGGATDQVTRITAKELEGALGTAIVVVNQPGASGSIGKKNVAEGAKDGYTWAAGAPKQLGTYKLLGLYDTDVKNWHLFLTVTNVPMVSVKPDAPYKDMGELLAAMKEKPGQISVATAGATSSGHIAMEAIAQATGVTYKHVTYDGGNPAVISTVAGETNVTTQLASEQAEMIRGKRLRPLAVVGSEPIEITGVGRIEPVTKWAAKLPEVATHFGIFLPKGVPPEVIATLEKIWAEKIANSEALKKYAGERGALFTPFAGEEAQKRVWPTIQADAWMLHAAGRTKMSPDSVGIPKP
jgi:tripartite-type tricarboxylate transporter receptor subunit TctC